MGYPTNKPKLLLSGLKKGDKFICANGTIVECVGTEFYAGHETGGKTLELPEFKSSNGHMVRIGSWGFDGAKMNAKAWPDGMNIVRRA